MGSVATRNWDITDEKKYIDGIGTWGERKRDRLDMLKKYRKLVIKRNEFGTWGDFINPIEILRYIIYSINKEQFIRDNIV